MDNFKWSEYKTETNGLTEYQYKDFDEYFKVVAHHLWSEKQWDNDTIKCWLENAFEDARIRK